MSFVFLQANHGLVHEMNPDDLSKAFFDYFPDAELGGDQCNTKASRGFWLELSSLCGKRELPICSSCKKASRTSGSTADSETWCMVGAHDGGIKREVIPLLHQVEVTLRRPVK